MNLQTIVIIVASAGMTTSSLAQSQPTATVSLSWKNTTTGDQSPLLPGQSAAIWVDVAFSPPVGTAVQTPLGEGEIVGLGAVYFDLLGSGNPGGSYRNSGAGFGGTPEIDGPNTNNNWNDYGRRDDTLPGWALGSLGGQGGGPMGGTIHDYMAGMAGQFPLTPTANHFNPVREIFRIEWTPDDYSSRNVMWHSRKTSTPTGTGVALLVQLPGHYTTIDVPFTGINWGALQIAVVPAPSGMMLLVVGAAGAFRRRRPRQLHKRKPNR